MKQETLDLVKKEATRIAREKGFGDNETNLTKMLWLGITELAEATEAERENKFANITRYEDDIVNDYYGENKYNKTFYDVAYKANIKDTFECEIAGFMVRLGHICGSQGFPLLMPTSSQVSSYEGLEDFSAICICISNLFNSILKFSDKPMTVATYICCVVACIIRVEKLYNFQIDWYVTEELKFFESRPILHQKAY